MYRNTVPNCFEYTLCLAALAVTRTGELRRCALPIATRHQSRDSDSGFIEVVELHCFMDLIGTVLLFPSLRYLAHYCLLLQCVMGGSSKFTTKVHFNRQAHHNAMYIFSFHENVQRKEALSVFLKHLRMDLSILMPNGR